MTQELAVNGKPNYFMPRSFEEAERFALAISKSALCPEVFRNKSGDVLIAMQMGYEVGLSPMQALQNICVIKGRPCIWGDGMVALVRVHPHCKGIRQWMMGSFADKDAVAYCGITRKGQPEEIRSFSYQQAMNANLLNKDTWKQYFERMLQWRATSWCCRDVFPDALRGLYAAEEIQDISEPEISEETAKNIEETKRSLESGTPLSLAYKVDEEKLHWHFANIADAPDKTKLLEVSNEAYKWAKGDKKAQNEIIKAKDDRKVFLESQTATVAVQEQSKDEWLDDFAGGAA